MEESSKAQKSQILSDWRSRFSPDELRLLVVQLDGLVELAQQEGAKCPSCGEELECSTSKCPRFNGGSLTMRAPDKRLLPR
jgi:tRNA(Ile2) C34 agmatinyltransferase TiaS